MGCGKWRFLPGFALSVLGAHFRVRHYSGHGATDELLRNGMHGWWIWEVMVDMGHFITITSSRTGHSNQGKDFADSLDTWFSFINIAIIDVYYQQWSDTSCCVVASPRRDRELSLRVISSSRAYPVTAPPCSPRGPSSRLHQANQGLADASGRWDQSKEPRQGR
jgi:hypothetical protein